MKIFGWVHRIRRQGKKNRRAKCKPTDILFSRQKLILRYFTWWYTFSSMYFDGHSCKSNFPSTTINLNSFLQLVSNLWRYCVINWSEYVCLWSSSTGSWKKKCARQSGTRCWLLWSYWTFTTRWCGFITQRGFIWFLLFSFNYSSIINRNRMPMFNWTIDIWWFVEKMYDILIYSISSNIVSFFLCRHRKFYVSVQLLHNVFVIITLAKATMK